MSDLTQAAAPSETEEWVVLHMAHLHPLLAPFLRGVQSSEWIVRTLRAELIAADAFAIVGGRRMLKPDRARAVLLEDGRRRAQASIQRAAARA